MSEHPRTPHHVFPQGESAVRPDLTSKQAQKAGRAMQKQGRGKIPSDVLGSYTGTPDNGEIPEQDPDDL